MSTCTYTVYNDGIQNLILAVTILWDDECTEETANQLFCITAHRTFMFRSTIPTCLYAHKPAKFTLKAFINYK